MKKTYIVPASKVHALQVVHMMALSQDDTTIITEENKNNFQQLGREDNNNSSKSIWENEW